MQFSTTRLPAPQVRRLLVVQRNPLVARSLARYLAANFDGVDVAMDREAAEVILADPTRSPTHLICGQYFGPDGTPGSALVRHWRNFYPSIRRAVIATSETSMPDALPGVDAVFIKPGSPAALLAALG